LYFSLFFLSTSRGEVQLAHLIEERRDEKLPIVPLPSEREMERRKTLAQYGREVRSRTRLINTLHALFVHRGHTAIVKKNLATAERRGEAVQVLNGPEREEAEWLLKHLELYEQRIKDRKDKSNVYYYGFEGKPKVLTNASSETFVSLNDGCFGYDSRNVFYKIYKLNKADPKTATDLAEWRPSPLPRAPVCYRQTA
jgi:hypothetical protein